MKKTISYTLALMLSALLFTGGATTALADSPPARAAAPAAAHGVVNLNSATAPELEMLPGVGPKKAQAIIDWRAKNKSFQRVDDLRKVKGFGRKTLAKLLPYLTVQGPTTLEAQPKSPRAPRPQ